MKDKKETASLDTAINNPDFLNKKYELLIQEFKEAWTHYRHQETMRNQYLGFFFTAIIGSLGFATNLFRNNYDNAVPVIILLLCWAVVLYVLSIILFTSVRKIGFVLHHYEKVFSCIREYFYFNDTDFFFDTGTKLIHSDLKQLCQLMNVRESLPAIVGRKVFKMQFIAESILWGTSALIMCLYLSFILLFSSIFPTLILCILILFGIFMIFTFTWTIYNAYKTSKKRMFDKDEDAL